MNESRQARLRDEIAISGLDGIVASGVPSLLYATGIRSVSQAVFPSVQLFAVIADDGRVPAVVLPYSEVPSVLDLTDAPWEVFCYGRLYFERGEQVGPLGERALGIQARGHETFATALRAALEHAGLAKGRLGLDESRLTPERWNAITEAVPDADFRPAYEILRWARRIKAPDEIECLERAVWIAEEALAATIATVREGVTERELARQYRREVLERGADPSLHVVTFGERAALADTEPTDNRLRRGEPMRFDVGCLVDGYQSDISRTAVLGRPTEKMARTYAAMLAGEDALMAATRPGATGEAIYEAGMASVRATGVPHYRRHHCGHGIGLEMYELPIVAPGQDQPLEAGMTFCLETPYYELGWGGVQVEDAIVVTDEGCRSMNRSSREIWRAGEG